MTATELIADLARQNVQVSADGDQLRVRAPKGVLTPELQAKILSRKSEVLAFLTERALQVDSITGDAALPRIVPASTAKHEPFPLTDIQQAYWVGRSGALELGTVACHAYYEVDAIRLDLQKFTHAFQTLIQRHDMLRAIILPSGTQQVLQRVPAYEIEILDLSSFGAEQVERALSDIRERMSHQVRSSDMWPLFEVRCSRLDDRRTRIHLSFDILTTDVWSLQIMFGEWEALYRDIHTPLTPLELSFRDYVLAEAEVRAGETYDGSRKYWHQRLENLPAGPDLPLAARPGSLKRPRFVRHTSRLEPRDWTRIKERSVERGLTPSGVVLSAFAEVLATWSKNPRFCVNVTIFNRLPLHPQVKDIIGDFTSFIPLEVDYRIDDSFEARAARIQSQFFEDMEHRSVGGVQIARDMARIKGGSSAAALPVVFTSLLSPHMTSRKTLWMGDVVYGISQTPQVWLDHQVMEEDRALVFNWDGVEDLFPEFMLKEMFEAYCLFLKRLATDESCWQRQVTGLIPQNQLEQRQAINDTEAPNPPALLQSLFEEQARRRPQHCAVVAGRERISYQELYSRSTAVALKLRNLGARPNTLVAVVMEKGWEQVAAVLGILQAGAAYLPIDPMLPGERIAYLLKHGEVMIALTQSWIEERLDWPDNLHRLSVDRQISSSIGLDLEPAQSPEDLAYVIYTSGSTGLPKGVMISHAGAINTIRDMNCRFCVGPDDRVLALSSLGFDLSVYDIFGTLAAGGTIVMPGPSRLPDPGRWAQILNDEQVTIWNSVPALMEMLSVHLSDRGKSLPESLRLVLLSGDWVPVTLPGRINSLNKHAEVISLGGATEASIWSILHPISKVPPAARSIPYGKPMANQRFHVLNEALEPCPTWVPGQLYIAGTGLALGYWRDDEKTSAGFIVHPRTGDRLYKTGDLGRYLPDGNIEFLGREDFQVKVQGYRIELGEIEAALVQHPKVSGAMAIAAGQPGQSRRLAAYIAADRSAVSHDDLKSFLKEKIPAYMIPQAFVFVDSLPLTPNGKVDRKRLPDPFPFGKGAESGASTSEPIEKRITECICNILQVDEIDATVGLIELGATSVDIIRVVGQLEKELGFRPTFEEFYSSRSVKELARSLEQSLFDSKAVAPSPDRTISDGPINANTIHARTIVDPVEREEFKKAQHHLRRFAKEVRQIELTVTDGSVGGWRPERRSHRCFGKHSISPIQLSRFLGCIRQINHEGPRYAYGSAGGLYPVQLYLYVKPGRIEGTPGGVYYYDPADHRLALISENAEIGKGIHEPFINAPIFEESAFSIFLVAELNAIAPMYGERSIHFATIEAGAMSQLLEMSAARNDMGLCQIGAIDFARVRELFELQDSQVLIHSLVGGAVQGAGNGSPSTQEPYYYPANTTEVCEEGEI